MNALHNRINNSDVTAFANAYADHVTTTANEVHKPYCAMVLPVTLQTFSAFKDCDTRAKLESSLTMLSTILAQVGAQPIKLVPEDTSTIKIGKDKASLSDYATVNRLELPKLATTSEIELPDAKALKTALGKVKHINALLVDSIVESIVNLHKPKAVDDTLYFVEYIYKDKAQTAIVAASNLQSLGDKIGDKLSTK